MTYAEMQSRMSNAEFELWLSEEALRADECPFCGTEPKELMEYEVHDIKCPVCKNKYGKVRRID